MDLRLSLSLFTVFVGELEKQQGAKTHSIKNNGTQLELKERQGSPGNLQQTKLRHTFICCISYHLHSTPYLAGFTVCAIHLKYHENSKNKEFSSRQYPPHPHPIADKAIPETTAIR